MGHSAENDAREQIADAIMRAPLPAEILDHPNVKAWFVEGVRWAATVARECDIPPGKDA